MILRNDSRERSRRGVLRGGVILLAGVTAALASGRAQAAGKTAKVAVRYQFTPKGDQHCGGCASFIPAADPAAPGTCKIVDGDIPPTGWCLLFSRKA
jgi:hypothetical protein